MIKRVIFSCSLIFSTIFLSLTPAFAQPVTETNCEKIGNCASQCATRECLLQKKLRQVTQPAIIPPRNPSTSPPPEACPQPKPKDIGCTVDKPCIKYLCVNGQWEAIDK